MIQQTKCINKEAKYKTAGGQKQKTPICLTTTWLNQVHPQLRTVLSNTSEPTTARGNNFGAPPRTQRTAGPPSTTLDETKPDKGAPDAVLLLGGGGHDSYQEQRSLQ